MLISYNIPDDQPTEAEYPPHPVIVLGVEPMLAELKDKLWSKGLNLQRDVLEALVIDLASMVILSVGFSGTGNIIHPELQIVDNMRHWEIEYEELYTKLCCIVYQTLSLRHPNLRYVELHLVRALGSTFFYRIEDIKEG